ncbi:MAG: MMPL family transporter [Treponema sp.]
MKRLTSLQNKTYLKFWILFHALAAIAFGTVFFTGGRHLNIDADLFNMLPKPVLSEALTAADAKLTEVTGQNVFILVSNPDFDQAKLAAEKVFSELKDSPRFKSIALYQDTSSFGSVTDFIHKYRWNLLDDDTIRLLNSDGGANIFAENALASAYGAFTITSLDSLESDPFMLGEHNLHNYLTTLQESGTKMSPKDGVLASFENERWYIMIRGVLSKEGAALASKTNAVAQIHKVCDALETEDTKFVYSGTPFHSYKSSSNASREIAIISTISMLAVLFILLLIFKRYQPILYSILLIFLSTATAICATFAVFGKMHILTLVFGTSLIGSCIDYSLHYFITWKANTDLNSGAEIRNHLFKGLTLSVISTVLCYFILVFAPFNLLKQMAVFSMSGIMSSFLTVLCIYPYIPVPKTGRKIKLVRFIKTPEWYNKKIVGRCVVTGMFIVSIAALIIFRSNLKIENKVNRLYKLEGRELENEKEAAKILQYSPSGWFIVSGDTAEETLRNEEKLSARLKEINAGKEKGGFVCTSAFVPSIEKQKASRAAAAKLLPLAKNQYEALGYEPELSVKLQEDFNLSAEDFVVLGKNVPAFLESSVSSAWIGEIKGKYYSVVLPVSVTDEGAYRNLADEIDGIYFINKINDMNKDLDELSKMILMFFAVVYVILFVVLKFFYTWKHTFKIISVPLLIVLFEAAIFAAASIPFEFFSITGMILVFGLGLDYVIYMIENDKRKDESENAKLEPFAIALSFITTAISFGALALSSFIPVHMIGLSILIGITTAYIGTFFYTRAEF